MQKEKQTAAAVTAEKSKSWKKLKLEEKSSIIWFTLDKEKDEKNFINFKISTTTTTDVFACMDMHYFRTLLSYFNTRSPSER
uniref:Uncharacterized protein n=1 Tax=Glossina palpalis gambiensis TaxID=67801 RepID=A0A1B0B801_9MUSC